MKSKVSILVPAIAMICAGPVVAQAALTKPASGAKAAGAAPAQMPLTRAELLKQLDARFKTVDVNKDGLVTKEELDTADKGVVRKVRSGRAKKRAELFNALDTNKDGQLSRAEFDAGDKVRVVAADPGKIITQLDTNRDGKLSAAEMQAPALANFNTLDANKDGVISPSERPKNAANAR